MISIFDIFSISIGPSSSHTAGPMRAAFAFCQELLEQHKLTSIHKITIDLYGSLALTGRGHKTDGAIFLGLEGEEPATVDPENSKSRVKQIENLKKLNLLKQHTIDFAPDEDLHWHLNETLPFHTNGLRFTALNQNAQIILTQVYYSVGGGFIVKEGDEAAQKNLPVPYPFTTAKDLWQICNEHNLKIKDVIFANELSWHTENEIRDKLLNIAAIMESTIKKGLATDGILEGQLKLKRRAKALYDKVNAPDNTLPPCTKIMDIINAYALATAEENSVGGRVITAPTNGAAGVIPAVLEYYKTCTNVKVTDDNIIDFLLTAGAIAILYKTNASISGAEVGCQGEVGVACSMAAGALVAAFGGTNKQIEKAAEIAMEHNLGLTCDPIFGLVQIPCIERNAMGAIKAVNAANLALIEGGEHRITLDDIMLTMLQTGKDMQARYKETSLGGLAITAAEC
ncbi:MAG: L-serine ammonia-lyase [Gammaproteobacteria bacterium]|nr:L-serine ammonia-lyase [Gammaproteobacteria bacterium]